MAFCLPPAFTDKFITALKDGTIEPEALTQMSSAERREFLGKIIGPENAQDVNALLESKLLLKDQNAGLVTWAKQTAGITEPQRRDFISRIEKLDRVLNPSDERAFLADLAAQKIGATVTADEAKTISQGAKNVSELKAKITDDMPDGSKERLAYGLASRLYHNYMNHLLGREAPTLAELVKNPKELLLAQPGIQKGINAAFDLSYLLRQGYKTLATNPDIWLKDTIKMFDDVGKELKGIDAMDLIHADILSRKNALNGKYKTAKAELALDFEEAFPESPVTSIPGLGRLYKTSETAFNGTALRMRADIMDRFIEKAEKSGLDMLNPAQAEPVGDFVNDMTGRGKIPGMTAGQSKLVNLAFFSIRFLKSNWDTLTAQTGGFFIKDAAVRRFVRIESAKNLAKLVGFAGGIMAVSNFLHPGSAELNPLSSNFGKIKIGQTTFDISGGMAPIVTLAARILTMQTKNPNTGQINELNSGKFGSHTALDLINNFFEGRASPFGQAILNYLRGQNYQGQKPTVLNTIANLYTPMPLQTDIQAMNEPNATTAFAAGIADFLGASANPPNPTGLDLPARDPVELELVRLGFSSHSVMPHTGNSQADEYITEELTPIADKNLRGFFASPGYARMGDQMKQAITKNMLAASERMAKAKATAAHPQFFIKLRQETAQQKHPMLQGAAP